MTVEGTPMSNAFQSPKAMDPRKITHKTSSVGSLASFIFPDIKALHEIRLESSLDLQYQEITVHGFEIYVVEQ
ncbi:hypothetical protein ZYGR_0AL00580 [Zygosaccharomyces rouxii]|uniref:STB6-like N-terminal domain-containing protein n=1 Tax=Zygosaccharomyces rouxii TaxID=4956 RepID=A0A1Q3AEY4_ZYGRO|nr:hypothetical protein ZYGR_0AL00580 [Zygosaccharomyces rouxii]